MSHPLIIEKSILQSSTPFKRWADSHPRYRAIFEIFKQSEIKALGLLGMSLATGLVARGDASLGAVSDWFTERASGLLSVDTGPTKLNPLIEGASALSFLTSIGYAVGGQVFDKVFKGSLRRQGLEALPKKWKNHTVVIDATRGLFDAVEELKPNDRIALVHDGGLVKQGEIEGGSLNSKTRRNLNSVGVEHLSDANFLASMNPQKAREIVINLCSMDSILASAANQNDQSKLPISLEKIFNILMTLKNILSKDVKKNRINPRIKLLIPERLKANDKIYLIKKILKGKLNVEFKNPETIFIKEVNKRVKEGIRFVTNIDRLSDRLKSLGLNINKSSKTVFVYKNTDDETILEAAKIKATQKDKTVVACIERKSNIDEAKASADFVWELPSLVAQKI